MTIRQALDAAAVRLAAARLATPGVDAEWLLGHVLGISRTRLGLDQDRELEPSELATLEGLLDRRLCREPLAYVLGEWGFRRLKLKVDARALVPRPETELLVERCLARIRGRRAPHVLDVGVGSGAIALAIADEHPRAIMTAVDSSPAAAELAVENAEIVGVSSRVDISVRDIGRGLSPGPFDLVVSNPPYVPEEELDGLEPEVRDWEPREALLDRGQTSLIAASARSSLKRNGWLALEIHPATARSVLQELESLGYADALVSRDLGGHDRVVEARWTL